MTITDNEALTRTIEHREIFHDEMLALMRPHHGRRDVAGDDGGAADRPARQEGDHRRDHRRRAGDARVLDTKVEVADRTHLVDIVGTGGDGAHLQHLDLLDVRRRRLRRARQPSTATGSVSSKSGSADVLEALGASLSLNPEQVAPVPGRDRHRLHVRAEPPPAMKNVAPVRKELGVRTIFNILGPLTNPAGAPNILMGVFHPDLVGIQVRVLQRLGAEHALVVYGMNGMDEVSLSARDAGRRAERTARSASTRSTPRTSACRWPATAR